MTAVPETRSDSELTEDLVVVDQVAQNLKHRVADWEQIRRGRHESRYEAQMARARHARGPRGTRWFSGTIEVQSWERQREDLAEALAWLESAEDVYPNAEAVSQWADSRVRQLRRDQVMALVRVAATVPALLAEIAAAEEMAKQDGHTITTAKARIMMLEAELKESGAKATIKRLKAQLEGAELEASLRLKGSRDTIKRLAKRRNPADQLSLRELESNMIVRQDNERLAKEVQRLVKENARLEAHVDKISGRVVNAGPAGAFGGSSYDLGSEVYLKRALGAPAISCWEEGRP